MATPVSNSRTRYCVVLTTSGGRLGNQLHQYAAAAAFSREHGLKLVNPVFKYRDLFEQLRGKGGTGTSRIPFAAWKLLSRLRAGRNSLAPAGAGYTMLPPSVESSRLTRARLVFLHGWRFRNPIGVRRHHAHIRGLFRPAEPHQASVRSFAADLPSGRMVVAVHIRQSDYLEFYGGMFAIDIERTLKAMAGVRERYSRHRPIFTLFSDGPLDEARFKDFECVFSRGEPIVDLYRMAASHMVVSCHSTFGAWAALYAGVPNLLLANPQMPPWQIDWSLPLVTDPAQLDGWFGGPLPALPDPSIDDLGRIAFAPAAPPTIGQGPYTPDCPGEAPFAR